MSYEQTQPEKTIIEWRPGVGNVVFIDEIEKAVGPLPSHEKEDIQPSVQVNL
jgi:hypothetical protein